MQILLDRTLAQTYKSQSQKIRVMTEDWVNSFVFCPACGNRIHKYKNNKPVADFYCQNCKEDFELKSKKNNIGAKIVDGAYRTMIDRLQDNNNPNFFLLNYTPQRFEILNFFIIPKHYFTSQIIEKRKPLSASARRSGWIGSNILLQDIPLSGRIFYIKDKKVENRENILKKWQETLFLRETVKTESKGWILDIMRCIDSLGKKEFSLTEMYSFEENLKYRYPDNKHIKDKIRQQLQFLRDKSYLEFLGRGKYRKIK